MPLIVAGDSPDARQVVPSQQPPPPQLPPGQHASPGAPQISQLPAEQVPNAQSSPSGTQLPATASQHPLVHASPAQHG